MFKKLFWVHIFIAVLGLFFIPQILDAATSNEAILNDLNKEWSSKIDVFDANVDLASLTEIERIQSHLATVAKHLEANFGEDLSKEQLANRAKVLDILKDYANQQCFPQNYYLNHRQPVFIDEHNTACAVGHLIRETGFAEITGKIQSEYNYGLIRELLVYPELSAWANNFGFSIEELAWVQPGYSPCADLTLHQVKHPDCGINNGIIDFEVTNPCMSGAAGGELFGTNDPPFQNYHDSLSNGYYLLRITLSGNTTTSEDTVIILRDSCVNNLPPYIVDDLKYVKRNQSINIDVLANDLDDDNNIHKPSLQILDIPTNGNFTINSNATVSFFNNGNIGYDSVRYVICDSSAVCDTGLLIVRSMDVNLTPLPIKVANNGTSNITFDDKNVIINPDFEEATYRGGFTPNNWNHPITGFREYGNFNLLDTITSNGTLTFFEGDFTYLFPGLNLGSGVNYTPNTGYLGLDSFRVTYCPDLDCACDTTYFVLNVCAPCPLANKDVRLGVYDGSIIDVGDNDSINCTNNIFRVAQQGKSSSCFFTDSINGLLQFNRTSCAEKDTILYSITNTVTMQIVYAEFIPFLGVLPLTSITTVHDYDTIFIGTSTTNQVLLNDFSNKGDVLFINSLMPLTSPPSNGTIGILPGTNTFQYTPNPTFTGNDTIGYMVCDSCLNCSESFYIITVADTLNTPPIAVDDCDSTSINTSIVIDVQANDIDFQGDTFFTIQAGGILPSNGLVNTLANDSMQYIPNAGFVGIDSFTYVICEYGVFTNCDTALVKIEVLFQNAAPMVRDTLANNTDTLYVVMQEDNTYLLCINYFDANNDTVNIQLLNDALGSSIIANDTCIQFTPPTNFNGQTLSQYVLCDNDPMFQLCDTFFVHYTVVPVNDLPIFVDTSGMPTNSFSFTMLEDGLLDTCFNFLGFDTGDVIQLNSFFGNSNGSLVITNDSCIRYQPNPNYNGLETFSLIVCDAGIANSCDTAIINITVIATNDKPEFTLANGTLTSTYTATINEDNVYNVCFNYLDVDGPMVTLVTANAQTGSTTTNNDTCLSYTPPLNWFGNDTVFLIICDNGSPQLCDTAELYIMVNSVNDRPNAVLDKDTTPLNTPITIDVIANDTDVEGDLLSLTSLTATSTGGTISQMGNNIVFTPDNNFTGLFSYNYMVCDNGMPQRCSAGSGTICISFMNDNPIAIDDSVSIFFGNSINIPVKLNDFDSVFANLTVTRTTMPFGGTAVVNPNGSFDYTPNVGFSGWDQFVYQICDEAPNQLCDEATVFVEVFNLQPKNSFSPNGDGQNDVFEIRGIENFSNNTLMIINRWGDVVFEQAPYDNTWRGGNKNDNPLPDGNYYYLLDLGDGSDIKKGSLLILR